MKLKAAGAGAAAATAASAGSAATAAIAGSAAGAVGAGGSGAAAVATGASILSGPVGWVLLGTEETENKSLTFDCWKKIIHDESTEKSKGRLLKDIVKDKRIKKVQANNNQLIIENIWNEKFQIDFYYYPKYDQFFAHAIPFNCE